MRPLNLTAEPDPRGGRVLLSWTTPTGDYVGTRVFRAETSYPDPAGADGSVVVLDDFTTPGGQDVQFLDGAAASGPGTVPLRGETVYYYAVVAFDSALRPSPAFVSAMATARYETSAYLYGNLPGVYQTFDTITPPPSPTLDPGEEDRGQLRRLLELFGIQFDLIRSYASGVRDFHTPARVDGALLPLLAQWIGWQTNYALPLAKQRNELRYAPHYWATLGIAANLRATLNRLVTWDARFKEFAHNIVRTNDPEQLMVSETNGTAGSFTRPTLVTLDVVFEGRPALCRAADGRPVLFYHARQSAPAAAAKTALGQDRFHIWVKTFDRKQWLAARRITWDGTINRSPAVVARGDGTFWLFYSESQPLGDRFTSRLRLQQIALGRGAAGADVETSGAGPFALSDGDVLHITVTDQSGAVSRSVAFHPEDFADITNARAAEVAAVLDREIPGIDVSVTGTGTVRLLTRSVGSGVKIALDPSAVLAKLGLSALPVAAGRDPSLATLTSVNAEPYSLTDGDTLTFSRDGGAPYGVTFTKAEFPNIASATASAVAAAINLVAPGAADAMAGRLRLLSAQSGDDSMITLDVNNSTAAANLGFAAAPPQPISGAADAEPSAFEDSSKNLWLFFASRRSVSWLIGYNRLAAGTWGAPKTLTTGTQPDREPSAVFDALSGRIWVFWSRKKTTGLWNVFARRTTQLDFNAIADADWTEEESAPIPADFDNREPAALLTGADALDLYFASNRANGWNVWRKTFSSVAQGTEGAVTDGPFTRRAPAPLGMDGGGVRVCLRSNESQLYTSTLYPAAATLDARYAGSVSADTRNLSRLGLRGSYTDILRYTYDTPRTNPADESARRYSHDTIGIFLTPDTSDEQLIVRSQTLIAQVLRRFLPIQVRAVLLIELAYKEFAYNYENPAVASPQFIEDSVIDTMGGKVVGGHFPNERVDRPGVRLRRMFGSGGERGSGARPLGPTS